MSSAIAGQEPIRVLHVLQRMEAGGTQAFLMNLYRNIDRSKVQFDFLVEYSEKQFYDDEIESMGGNVYRTSFREDFNLIKFKRDLKQFFEIHNRYDIIHCHVYTVGYFVLKAAKKTNITIRIAHSHNNNMSGVTKPLKIVMRHLFSIYANRFMACSDEAGAFLFGNRAFTVIRNAIDVDKFTFSEVKRAEIRQELGLEDAFVVGNVGRLHHQKNQLFLLDVFKEILLHKSNSVLLLVGNGPLRQKLLSKAVSLSISDRIILLSDRHDMDRLYQAMDVFVLPSLYEGFGIVAIEAQSAGLPTICSSGVAKAANVSKLFSELSLDDSPSVWAEKIIAANGERDSFAGSTGARSHGFDIKSNSLELQNWYLREAEYASR